MDRFRLIAEIRKRPALWDFQSIERSRLKIADLWKEVASGVGDDVTVEACKCKWKHMRDAYRTETKRSKHRIERDIRKGKYDTNKNYHSKWVYFDHMKFVDSGARPRTKDYKSNDNDSDQGSNLNISENTKLGCEMEIVYSNSVSQLNGDDELQRDVSQFHWQSYQGPPPLKRLNNLKRHNSLSENNKNSKGFYTQLNLVDDSDIEEEMLLQSNSSNRHSSDNNDNESSKQYATLNDIEQTPIKIEPDIDIEADTYPMENENDDSELPSEISYRRENSLKAASSKRLRSMEKTTSLPKQKQWVVIQNKSSERPCYEKVEESLLTSLPVSSTMHNKAVDPDTNFLISFSSHLKSMSQLLNLQFRAKMSELILNILSSTESSNAIEGSQIPSMTDINDPDSGFLISFLPHLKSMSQLQNLQFRAKMSDLMLSLLSTSLSTSNTYSDSTTAVGASNN